MVVPLVQHAQAKLAVIEQQGCPDPRGLDDLVVGKLDAADIAGGGAEVEAEAPAPDAEGGR